MIKLGFIFIQTLDMVREEWDREKEFLIFYLDSTDNSERKVISFKWRKLHLFSFPWWLIWGGQKSHGYIHSGFIWKVSYCTVMPCKCHQRIIRFSVTSTFRNFRSVWSVSVWNPWALTLELLVPFCFCGKGVQHGNGHIWILLMGFGYLISHTTLLIWRCRKMCKGKDENKGF